MTEILIYLLGINILTFFIFGIDKWRAKNHKWRIPEATLLLLALLGGSAGALIGMEVWNHKKKHEKFVYGLPLILLAQIVLFLLCSCRSTEIPLASASATDQNNVSVIADKVWDFSKSHPDGFTLDIRTMTEPKEGIAVSYAATQDSHSRDQLERVVHHALQNDGYVGGWYNREDSLYYFDSTRLFAEDSLDAAIQFARENAQHSVFILSTRTDIPLESKVAPFYTEMELSSFYTQK